MKADLSCPLELWEYKLPDAKFGVCTLHIFNLENKILSSAQVRLTIFDKDGNELLSHVERPMALDAAPKQSFTIVFNVEEYEGLGSASVVFEKAWFVDGTQWRRASQAQLTEYEPNELPQGRDLENLRYVAGPDAVGYPSNQGDIWLCVCGRANLDDEDVCRRCGRSRSHIFINSSRKAVAEAIGAREMELERKAYVVRDNIARTHLLDKNVNKRREITVKRRFTGALCGAAAIALLYLLIVVAYPSFTYFRAASALESGDTATARSLYESLIDYKDSRQMLLECNLKEAEALISEGDKQSVATALALLSEIGDYGGAKETLNEASYKQALILMEYGEYEKAAEAFASLAGYMDSREQFSLAQYRIATRQMNSGEYEAAYEKFVSLGQYEDAAELAKQCLYRPAELALSEKRYDDAAELYSRIPDYLDSETKLVSSLYQAGISYQLADEFMTARERFIQTGTYLDSQDMLRECTYHAAIALRDSGEYARAVELLAEIPDYKDAQSLIASCSYEPAKDYMAAQEYDKAIELLSNIPDYEDARQLIQECSYLPAKAAIASSDWKTAVELLAKIPGYKDSDPLILEAKYKIAMAAEDSGDLAGAAEQYDRLGDYLDSKQRANQCRYTIAASLFSSEDYKGAEEMFASLGTYSDSAARVLACQFAQAESIRDSGDLLTARSAFQAITGYAAATEAANEISYTLAENARATGDLIGASEYFKQAGNTRDAAQQANQCIYDEATKWMNSLDYQKAGELFDSIEAYADSKAKSDECYDLWLADILSNAKALEQADKLDELINQLGALPLESIPDSYAEIKDVYIRANISVAKSFISDDKLLEAYEYLKNAEAVAAGKDLSDIKDLLGRRIFFLLGEWESGTGTKYAFYTDYSCVVNDETGLYFNLRDYTVRTGHAPDSLANTLRLQTYNEDQITVKDNNNRTIRLKRTSGNVSNPTEVLTESVTGSTVEGTDE
ncbi:MAG: hypothetical protein LBD16_07445 [Oscillospiraceae bacterium]|nr:hypothetical protein [Oscillospiraceae bacterium]